MVGEKNTHFNRFPIFVLSLSIPPFISTSSLVCTIDNALEYIYDVTIENASGRGGMKRDRNFCINGTFVARYSFCERARKIKRFIFISRECRNDFIVSLRRFQFPFNYVKYTFNLRPKFILITYIALKSYVKLHICNLFILFN